MTGASSKPDCCLPPREQRSNPTLTDVELDEAKYKLKQAFTDIQKKHRAEFRRIFNRAQLVTAK
jgi:hypothetical protein